MRYMQRYSSMQSKILFLFPEIHTPINHTFLFFYFLVFRLLGRLL